MECLLYVENCNQDEETIAINYTIIVVVNELILQCITIFSSVINSSGSERWD